MNQYRWILPFIEFVLAVQLTMKTNFELELKQLPNEEKEVFKAAGKRFTSNRICHWLEFFGFTVAVGTTVGLLYKRRIPIISKQGLLSTLFASSVGFTGGSIMGMKEALSTLTTLPPNSKISDLFFKPRIGQMDLDTYIIDLPELCAFGVKLATFAEYYAAGITLGFISGIYLSRRGAFTRLQRTFIIFGSSLAGEWVGRQLGESAGDKIFGETLPYSPIHKMTSLYWCLTRQIQQTIKRSCRDQSDIRIKDGELVVISDGDPYQVTDSGEKVVKRNKYGDIID